MMRYESLDCKAAERFPPRSNGLLPQNLLRQRPGRGIINHMNKDPSRTTLMRPHMNSILLLACLVGIVSEATASAADPAGRVYEMRVYYAAPGKLDALHSRFRDHTCKLFEKHGITNIGYFVPIENAELKLVYFLAYPSRDARAAAWKAFMADPDWQKAYKASELDGKLVAKVESAFMQTTDYSPELKVSAEGNRIFEMRTYTATPDHLDNLNARFRNHTCKLFEKHGMTNIVYWNLMPDQKGADNTLIYLLGHKSVDAAKASFAAFGKDPDWMAARTASEAKAGSPLTIKGGVNSLYMTATDYSPLK